MILPTPPNRIGILKPEGRGIGSNGEIYINIRSSLAPFADEADGSMEIDIERAARNRTVYIACTVNLELVNSVSFDEIESNFLKTRKIFGAGECKPLFVGFKPCSLPYFTRSSCGLP